jgi:hypothetical protein
MGWGFREWMREQAGENIAAWQDHLRKSKKFEAHLWKSADNLRRTSLGHHATHCSDEAKADKAAGKMPDRPPVEADFTRRRSNLESWHILRRI